MAKTNYSIPRWKRCAECGVPIEQRPGRGQAVKYCSAACKKEAKRRRKESFPDCAIDECERKARSGAPGSLCEMHYYRRYLTGEVGEAGPRCGGHKHCHYCGAIDRIYWSFN